MRISGSIFSVARCVFRGPVASVSLLMLLLSCAAPSESSVRLVVDADDAIRAQSRFVRIVLAGRPSQSMTWEEAPPRIFDVTTDAWPVELTFPPKNGDSSRVFLVKATSFDANDEPLIAGRLIGRFTRGKSEVRMMLTADCLSSLVRCNAEQTCERGQCVDAHLGADAGVPDAGPPDVGTLDGGTDACVERAVYRDEDDDGFGVASSRLMTCTPMDGYVESDGDCNDTSRETRPGTAEACDGADNNCNMQTDEGCACTTGATRACGTDTGECALGVQRCVAGVWSTTCEGETPASAETCDGRDNDCDGSTDEGVTLTLYRDGDGDGFGDTASVITGCAMTGYVGTAGDCNDSSRTINPSATETCDGINNDCDGTTDEGCGCISGTTRACGTDTGECRVGTETCTAGTWTGCSAITAVTETCDGRDNDCDGSTDDGATCTARPNTTSACASGACNYTCRANYGDCDATPSNGCEATLLTDARNCGRCGNSCGTGTCTAGVCSVPTTAPWCTADLCDISTIDAPSARYDHTAVWTGSEMIVWGGYGDGGAYFNTGAAYNPSTNEWTTLPTSGAPSARFSHTAVWTDSEMIVWGGYGDSGNLNTGARYNPLTRRWTALPTTGAPSVRDGHTAVWTDSEMIVWGGFGSGLFNNGARYNPSTNEWTALPTTGAPSARTGHTAVWTGSEMVAWGGNGVDGYLSNGARYNPSTAIWTALPASGAPSARYAHTAVWTDSEMIVWGGRGGTGVLNTGARYNPLTDEWTALPTTGAPAARWFHAAVWSVSEMIVWGGFSGGDTGWIWRL